ncbi:NAD(P)/FAD-dependent oxidoreductase [Alkalibacterium indicireducens]|uniref:NAD(P)/FAD-dependent oxidoreductase n=1 Tax=Alkalibacterium indicireducens TaxID=398758 RepID=A0ABN1AZJ7_9LACT
MTQDSVKHFDYLMVGGGTVAGFAAKGIREVDKDGTIGIISSENDSPYTRPALTKKIWTDDDFTEEDVPFHTEETGAEIFLQTTAVSIDKENKAVRTSDGHTFSYGKLLLATGGQPQRIEGPDDSRVLAFRTFDDYRTLRSISGSGNHVIVVGGSYIGTELAANLALNNTKVTFIYPQDTLSDNRLPKELAEEYENTYKNHGIKLISGTRAVSYDKDGDDLVVTLDNGEKVYGDAIVLGLGVKPLLELAEESGLEVDEGVVTDTYLRTSDPDIFTAGDIAYYPDPILGRNRIEHVDHARKSGTTAGKNMAGAQEPYDYTPYFYSMVFDISWKAIGTLDPELDYYIDEVDGGKVVYYLEDNKPVGILTWNVDPDLDEVRNVLSNPPESKDALKGLIREKEDSE